MKKKMIKQTGGCFCGEVKFTVKLDEEPRVFNCHCIDCRKKIGGMITIVQLREDAIEIDKTKLKTYEHQGGSQNTIKKFYCKICAAPILTYVSKWDKSYLYAGMLDDINILKKANNIFYEDSHFPFMEISKTNIKT
jgi:hypothetical protein